MLLLEILGSSNFLLAANMKHFERIIYQTNQNIERSSYRNFRIIYKKFEVNIMKIIIEDLSSSNFKIQPNVVCFMNNISRIAKHQEERIYKRIGTTV